MRTWQRLTAARTVKVPPDRPDRLCKTALASSEAQRIMSSAMGWVGEIFAQGVKGAPIDEHE
jgi:hypothetical protein